MTYKGYDIDKTTYKNNGYIAVNYEGDDLMFDNLGDAFDFIDQLPEEEYVAIFNPEARRWEQQAYAIVGSIQEEKEICLANGYSSSQRRELNEFETPAGKFYLQSLTRLGRE